MPVKIKCPCCNNQRLFDMFSAGEFEIEIKCQRCRKTIHLSAKKNKVMAKAI